MSTIYLLQFCISRSFYIELHFILFLVCYFIFNMLLYLYYVIYLQLCLILNAWHQIKQTHVPITINTETMWSLSTVSPSFGWNNRSFNPNMVMGVSEEGSTMQTQRVPWYVQCPEATWVYCTGLRNRSSNTIKQCKFVNAKRVITSP